MAVCLSGKTLLLSALVLLVAACEPQRINLDTGFDEVSFVGRTDFSCGYPRQYASGAYFSFAFEGDWCQIDIEDQNLYGTSYNYISVLVDSLPPVRIALRSKMNKIALGNAKAYLAADTIALHAILPDLSDGVHTVEVVRDTESQIGYTALRQLSADRITKWLRPTNLKIEFVGNSITCGTGAFCDSVPCETGVWHDQHCASLSYGPRCARTLNAQWMLTSVSGIGLIRSCCDMEVRMPDVYDKTDLRLAQIPYDFSFNPDVICICLGQNDGIQPVNAFVEAYVNFLATVSAKSPAAHLVLLSSPMADDTLREWQSNVLQLVAKQTQMERLHVFCFSQNWTGGCASHPSVAEHEEIANQLSGFLQTIL